ncbi:MAG: hypothetical protein JWO03_2540 [Bacteroidetes bacterium]|nr:hypothetical protein [Bacteroidota bacterium]
MIYSKWMAVFLLVCLMGFQSCKKGCNNPKAFNFQANAKENDGTCLYCDSTRYTYTQSYTTIYDYTFGSPYQGQPVIAAMVNQDRIYYTGNGCKLLGKTNNNNGAACSNFSYMVILNNQIGRTITFSGDITVSPYSSSVLHYHASGLTLAPYGSDSIYVGTACSYYSSFTVNTSNESFVYQ